MQLKLPELGEGVHEGEMVKWKVKKGEMIKEDQILCEIMTDKATIELPSSFQGKVISLLVKEGVMIKVGQSILEYEGGTKDIQPTRALPSVQAVPIVASPSLSPLAAPSVRKLAREMGIDLSLISGTGSKGRVMRDDLMSRTGTGAVSAGPPTVSRHPQTGEERVAFRGLRKKIAEKMRLSIDKAAHFTYVEEADATELVNLRTQIKKRGAELGIKITYLPFILKAMVAALRKFPILNSTLDEEKAELIYKYYYNIGISIQTDEGLTAPVIKNVENQSLLELSKNIQSLIERARTKRLTLEDFRGGTITLTNAGSIGGLFATPVINFPEVAILGFNKIFKKPVVKEIQGRNEIVIRDWTYFSISLDHRIVDGAVGAEFMKEFIRHVEAPSLLLLETL